MIKCEECKKEFKYLTERHLLKCCGLTTSQYKQKHPNCEIYSIDWKKSVIGQNNPRYIDGRAAKRKNHLYICKECGIGITGRGKTGLCFLCSIKHIGCSKSKIEKDIYKEILKIFPDAESNKPVKNNDRGFLPDIVFKPNILVEVYGDYWHANPNIYSEESIMKRGILAKEIWEMDRKRQLQLEELGYIVKIIWEKDWKLNRDSIIFELKTSFDWDACIF